MGCQIQRDFSGLYPSYTNPHPDLLHFNHSEFPPVPLLPHAPHILSHLQSGPSTSVSIPSPQQCLVCSHSAFRFHSNCNFLEKILLDFPDSMCSCHSSKFIPNITCISLERAQGAQHPHLDAKLPGSKSWHHYILVVGLITSYLTWLYLSSHIHKIEIKAVFA